jgi:Protein of unknown function (DUF3237)
VRDGYAGVGMLDQQAQRSRRARRSALYSWLNKGVFVGVGGRQAAGVVYEVYLVD